MHIVLRQFRDNEPANRCYYNVYDEFMELIETGGDVSFDITPYLQNQVALKA